MQFPPNLTERAKYFFLMALTCEDLKPSAVDLLAKKGHDSSVHSLNNVRTARKHSLVELIQLVKVGIPTFEIPAELMPEKGKLEMPPLFRTAASKDTAAQPA